MFSHEPGEWPAHSLLTNARHCRLHDSNKAPPNCAEIREEGADCLRREGERRQNERKEKAKEREQYIMKDTE